MIYAIEAIGLDRVKFGRAKNPDARFKVLSTGSPVPLDLIIVAPWPDHYEGMIHRAFADERITGEWFMVTKRVERFCHAMGMPGVSDRERHEMSMAILESVSPKCRLCHKEHYGICSSSDLPDGPGEVIGEEEPAGIDGVTKPRTGVSDPVDLGYAGQKLGRSAVKQTPSLTSTQKATVKRLLPMLKALPAALTPAEKQKAYRERHKDRVQEADRERKRKKRE